MTEQGGQPAGGKPLVSPTMGPAPMPYGPVSLGAHRPEPTTSPVALAAVIGALGVVGLLIVVNLLLSHWPGFGTAALYFVAGVVFPTLIALSLMPRGGRRSRIAVAVVMWLLAAVALGAWSQPSVRASAVHLAATDPHTMRKIFADSPEVASVGCVFYGGMLPDPDWIGPYVAELEAQPQLAGACLSAIHPTAAAVALESLDPRWTGALYSDAATDACEIAKSYPTLPIGADVVAPRLVSCALQGSATARPCCAEALKEVVPNKAEWDATLARLPTAIGDEKTMVALYDALFNKGTVESPFRDAFLNGVQGRGISSQHIALDLMCDQLELGSQVELVRFLHASIEGRCSVDASRLNYDTNIWSRACRETQRAVRQEASTPPLDVLCEHTNAALVAHTVEVARSIIGPAAHRRFDGAFADAIDDAYNDHLDNGFNLNHQQMMDRETLLKSRPMEKPTFSARFRDPDAVPEYPSGMSNKNPPPIPK